ncbi:MAG: SagB/ThcOx family dehydrogenase [Deltaproteobacteria bacterium]|jgi:hypothetical protein|nr:SagB/ThcOx family dehydrogenase [Deltaproteobacteria bacterium]
MFAAALRLALILGITLSWTMSAPPAMAQDTIQLPAVEKTGGMPLLEALAARHSERGIKEDALSEKQLSEILWSAFGVNRDDGKRVIPTARGKNELAVYAVLTTGVYLYDPAKNVLTLELAGDHTADYEKSPLTLLFAAPDNVVGGLHAGSAYQGAGLYCASAGLANVVKGTGADNLKGQLKLPDGFEVLVVQLIGLPG